MPGHRLTAARMAGIWRHRTRKMRFIQWIGTMKAHPIDMEFLENIKQLPGSIPKISVWLLLLSSSLFAFSNEAFCEIPRGVFCLLPVGAGAGQDALVYDNPDVDGVSVRENWSDIEPTEN